MIKKLQLKNGLTVLLVESHKSPVVSVQMWVRTGSADEAAKLRGISHFIEHLVFKGSKKFGVGEIAATVEGSGGELNAYTSFDQTVFYVTISRQYLDTGLEVISEMMGRPAFVAEEIDNEREVVIEEIKRSMDSPHRQASRLLFESLYKRHPYGEPVIGYEEIIRKVSRQEIVKYFTDRYGARNMTLLVVGDFTTAEMKPKLDKFFGDLGNQKVRPVKRAKEPTLKKSSVQVRGANFKENFLFLAWPTPPADHKDLAALEVLAMIYGQGDSSRLNQAMRIDKNLVNYVGSSVFSPMDSGFFAVSASLPPGGYGEALQEIQTQWQRLRQELVSSEELGKAVVNLSSEQYYNLETVDGMARKYGHYEHLYRDYRESEKFLKQVRGLTPKDLLAVAKKYLRPDRMIACALTPQGEEASKEKELKNWLKALKFKNTTARKNKSAGKMKLPKQWFPPAPAKMKNRVNQAERVQLKSGATVLLRPNFDTPVVSLRMAFLGGARLETASHAGLNEMLSRTWVSATKNRSEMQLMAAIDNCAGTLSAFGGRNTAGLNLGGLKPFTSDLLGLFGEVLLEPELKLDVIEREKSLMLEQLRTRQDNPAQVAILNFSSTLFGDHPYGRDPLGRAETLANVHEDKLISHMAKMRTSRNATISVAGHFDRDEILKHLEKLTSELPKGDRLMSPIPVTALTAPQKKFSVSNKEQVHLVLGHSGLKLTDPDRYSLQVLEAVLAGQGGRLFVELRDKNSLAYSVSPLRMEGIEGGYFGAYIGCSPDKGAKALRMLREQLQKVASEKIRSEELVRAQRYLIGRHDIDLQRNSAMAAALLFDDIYGIDFQETFHYAERVQAITVDDVLKVAAKILKNPEVLSAVGPREPWAETSPFVEQQPNL
ncbi:MAG: M16 family metallopeptidase [Bdellovibrionales bacterium]